MRYFQAARGRRVFMYHNITPASYFRGWSRDLELLCDIGRRILPSLTGCDLAVGDSEYNRQELVAAGFSETKTAVLPLFSQQSAGSACRRGSLEHLRAEGAVNLMTVGRVAPNKALEDVIRIFYVYQRAINPRSRLYIVGPHQVPAYSAALETLVADLGLGDVVRFPGRALGGTLKAYYQAADLYLAPANMRVSACRWWRACIWRADLGPQSGGRARNAGRFRCAFYPVGLCGSGRDGPSVID